MPQDEMLICRRCKVAAQAEFVDGEMASIACPSCGLLVEGDTAHEMYLNQVRYLAIQKARNVFKGAFSKSRSVRYEPSRMNEPRGPSSSANLNLSGYFVIYHFLSHQPVCAVKDIIPQNRAGVQILD